MKAEIMVKTCLFCGVQAVKPVVYAEKTYWYCSVCRGAFLHPSLRLSREEEKKRYELHDNSLENTGYRTYLNTFLDEIILKLPKPPETVFDYGSGPEPALVSVLQERGFEAKGYDPFFASDTLCFDGGADLVTCLEVAEHFSDPVTDFARLASCVKTGGYAAIATQCIEVERRETPERDLQAVTEFLASWWYRQDPTHIVFYSPEALEFVSARVGLVLIGKAGKSTWLFTKD